jgi:MFS family permease
MDSTRRNVALLSSCQALLFTNNVTLIAINGLAGYVLAPDKGLATLPVTAQVIGSALSTIPASLLMQRIGRRAGFQIGSAIGIAGGALATLAIYMANFWLLCLGTMILGIYGAFGLYYRFAAADSAEPEFKAKAISLVLAGGLVGGIIGPELSKWTRNLAQPEFLASYASLMVFCLLSMTILSRLRIPNAAATGKTVAPRPLAAIAAQPGFIVAVTLSAIGYGVMNLLMTATPLAMGMCGHPYSAAATVISSHVIAMFAPSFITGFLIQRFGVLTIMLTGVASMFACVAIALSGIDVAHFWLSLVLLGLGWNFMYVGGTTLLTGIHRPNEKAKTQGMHDFLVFGITAVSSFSSGMLLKANGWQMLNYVALPFLMLAGAACLWLMLRRTVAAA